MLLLSCLLRATQFLGLVDDWVAGSSVAAAGIAACGCWHPPWPVSLEKASRTDIKAGFILEYGRGSRNTTRGRIGCLPVGLDGTLS